MRSAVLVAVIVATSAFATAFARGADGGAEQLAPGEHRIELRADGRSRSYLVYVPSHVRSGRALPLVLNFHGGGSNAEQQRDFSKMNELAGREGFVVVYPNGTGMFRERFLTWNAGTCCGYAQQHGVDDVGFSLAVVRDMSRRVKIDRRRIYATGMSNGGMMAHRLGAEASDVIAAIAPVAGGMVVDSVPSTPMPVMHFHSLDDPRAPYAGGLGPSYPATTHRVRHPSIAAVMRQWARHDECRMRPAVGRTISRGEHSATRLTYAPCRAKAEVVLWKLTGAGHVWPGGKQDVPHRILGPPTTVVDANAEMWRFFTRHARA